MHMYTISNIYYNGNHISINKSMQQLNIMSWWLSAWMRRCM